MKTCYCCKIKKNISEFGNQKQKKDGLQSNCKHCTNLKLRDKRKGTGPTKGSYLWHLQQSGMTDYYKRYTTNS